MASGGTEAFPDLGKHCQHRDCNQLDFLPFTCDGCQQVRRPARLTCGIHGTKTNQFIWCFVWNTDPTSPIHAQNPTTTAERWLFAKHVPCPLRPPATWDKTKRQSCRSISSLVSVTPPRRRNQLAPSSVARRF
ncbi:uncharacterized protein [Glycine max]|uniref:uncharacterized protein isoform X2 n=1 Tax=Glycine max TaxID=3847 RepID=UPI001B3564FA|nr:uncharacterized protein LOC100790041 isoform X2 [Glycine max]